MSRIGNGFGVWGSRGLATIAVLAIAAFPTLAGQTASPTPIYTDNSVISTGSPPVEGSFIATTTETVDVTLTDLGALNPLAGTPLSAVNLVVTSGGAVANAIGTPVAPATLSSPGTVSFAATAGTTYQVRVVGVPNTASSSGSDAISVGIASHTSGLPIANASFSGTFQAKTPTSPNPVFIEPLPFTVTQSGDYAVTLTDQAVPVALSSLRAIVLQGSTTISMGVLTAGTTTLPALAAGTYQIYVYATAATGAGAGLFGVQIAPAGGGTAVFDRSYPVGSLTKSGPDVVSATAQSVTLSVTDLAAPSALKALAAAVTNGSALLATANPTQPTSVFNAPASPASLQVWTLTAPVSGGAGAYGVSVAPATGAPLYATQAAVADPTGNLYPTVVSFSTAGGFDIVLTDIELPAALSTLNYKLYQGDSIVSQATASAGTQTATVAAGSAVFVVQAIAPTGGNGLYSSVITPHGGGTSVLSATNGVGNQFTTRAITFPTAGNFNVNLTDLGWPANFQTLGIALTQNGALVGKLLGNGALPVSASAGNYTATIIGVPGATGHSAGLYDLTVTPAPPVVSLSASPTSLTVGQGTRLTWTATGATSCTGAVSGAAPSPSAFSGNQSTSGNVNDGPFTAAGVATYTLTCTGDGGMATGTATVTATAATSGGGSGGGGGALGWADALLIVAAMALRAGRRAG